MYKISDFSKITSLTVKALRYYDEEQILTPSGRDGDTGYRYYSEEDYQKAQLIVLLRSLEFSISEIRDVLANCADPDDLPCYLEEKKHMIEGRIKKEKELIKRLSLYIKPKEREEISMDYQVEQKEIAPVLVAAIRYKGKYSDVAEYKEDGADLELCLPIKKKISHPDVTVKTLPAVKAICTTHKGSYEKLNRAYKALMDYANQHGLNIVTPSREIYIKGPGMVFRGNEDNYVTEIIIPYEEK